MLGILSLIYLSAAPSQADFYLTLAQCKTVVTMVDDRSGIIASDGDPATWACKRDGKKMKCNLKINGELKALELSVEIDSPPMLVMNRNGGADHVLIDAAKHIVVSTTRMLGGGEAPLYGSKVCKGLFFTAVEFEALRKQDDGAARD